MIYKTKPTAQSINLFVEEFKKKNNYDYENYEASLKLTQAFIKNDNYQNIYIKVNFINGAFKTTISDTFGVAKQIFKNVKNIDKRLDEGDEGLIKEIAKYKSSIKKFKRSNYSFATKYCPTSWRVSSPDISELILTWKNMARHFKYSGERKSHQTFKEI
jgi:hypothetical protein